MNLDFHVGFSVSCSSLFESTSTSESIFCLDGTYRSCFKSKSNTHIESVDEIGTYSSSDHFSLALE